jgi:hypothetical protein
MFIAPSHQLRSSTSYPSWIVPVGRCNNVYCYYRVKGGVAKGAILWEIVWKYTTIV